MRYIQILSLLACAQVAIANPISLQARAKDVIQPSQSTRATQLFDNPGELDATNPSQDRMEDTRSASILPRIADLSNAALDAENDNDNGGGNRNGGGGGGGNGGGNGNGGGGGNRNGGGGGNRNGNNGNRGNN